MRQHGSDHGANQQACADQLFAGDPKQDRGDDFDGTGDIAEPLADADGVKGADHHFVAGDFEKTRSEESQREQGFGCDKEILLHDVSQIREW